MEEKFLHFVWGTQSFEVRKLATVDGQGLEIFGRGKANQDQGPDFLGARIKIGYPDFAGAVEIHNTTEEWYAHGHHLDPNYNSVILHVVGKSSGKPVRRQDGSFVPEFSLEKRIPPNILSRYQALEGAASPIICGPMLKDVDPLTISSTLDAMGVNRMQEKGRQLQGRKTASVVHWQQLIWEELCRGMGGTVNGDAFADIAHRIPVELVNKVRGKREELEALLLGTGGLLPDEPHSEAYIASLQSHWQFLKMKHGLQSSPIPLKYLRMRPTSFPPIRLSQIAALAARYPTFIELLLEDTLKDFLLADIRCSEYWESHIKVGVISAQRVKRLGEDLRRSLVINSFLPLAGMYYEAHGLDNFRETAVNILEDLAPEENQVVRLFGQYGVKAENALRSQGLIELKKSHCDLKKCLNCRLGQKILTDNNKANGANAYSNRGDRGRGKDRQRPAEHAGSDGTGIPHHGGRKGKGRNQ